MAAHPNYKIVLDPALVTLPNDIGSKSCTIDLKSPFISVSTLSINVSFAVVCETTSFGLVSPLPDFTYYIGSGTATIATVVL